MMESKVAFATYAELPDLIEGDRLAVDALKKRGIWARAALWDDPGVDWSQYRAVVIRSCWDYHLRADEFLVWLAHLETLAVTLWNPVKVIRWNMDKTYLRDLQERGVLVLPSIWLPAHTKVDLAGLMKQQEWDRVVVKPVISAAADHTHLVSLDKTEEYQTLVDGLLQQGGLIVQEFASEIATQGEWSFLFFGGEYSHAVLKRPTAGDFRVQPHLGGTHAAAHPTNTLVEHACAYIDAVDADLLYARVDAIEREDKLFLMELELIEPYLFFPEHPQAAGRFADALVKQLAVKE